MNRGNAWQAERDYDKAIADLSEAIRLIPQSATAYNNRGNAWSGKKNYDMAIADFDHAIRLDPRFGVAFNNRGIAWSKNKNYLKALADFEEATRLDPARFPAYAFEAWIWATCPDDAYRQGEKAVEAATKACELSGWRNAFAIQALAAAYAEVGDFDAAVVWQEKVNDMYDNDFDRKIGRERLELFESKEPYREKPVNDSSDVVPVVLV
jgi:tetratricopeptide (TPR) repeat protein